MVGIKLLQPSYHLVTEIPAIVAIDSICEDLKALIIENEIGQKSIPQDFEAKNILIKEGQIGSFFVDNPLASKLLADLKTKIVQYNARQSDKFTKILIEHSFLSLDVNELGRYSNYFILNNISQIQFQLIYALRMQTK